MSVEREKISSVEQRSTTIIKNNFKYPRFKKLFKKNEAMLNIFQSTSNISPPTINTITISKN